MKKLREIWRRLGFYFRREQFDRELDDEMRFHLAMKARAKTQDGIPLGDAQLAARRQFGNDLRLKERSREMWTFNWIESISKDLKYTLRMIRKSPVFASVVVLSLALAIGVNTAIFSLVNAVLLKTLPVKNPKELVLFGSVGDRNTYVPSHSGMGKRDKQTGLVYRSSLSSQMFERMKQENQTLTDLFAFAPVYHDLNVSVDNQAAIASGQYVSGGYYKGLGVGSILGRTITDEDDRVGAPPVAVISYHYWVERFRQDPAIIGKPAFINAQPFTIIGVSQPGFQGTFGVDRLTDITVPLAAESQLNGGASDSAEIWNWWLRIMGRLKPGVTIEQARASFEPTVQQSAKEELAAYLAKRPNPQVVTPSLAKLTAISGSQGEMFTRQEYSKELYVLLIIVGMVLLIACVNVANLLLARSGARQREIAIRIALGAGRSRLVRQLMTESLFLSLAGGLAGFILAYWAKSAAVPISPFGNEQLKVDMSLDFRVLGFSAAVSILAGLLFGIAPALKATKIDPGPALKETAASQGGGRSRLSLGKGLIVVQVALSIILLVGAGLFLRTLRNLERVDYGFDAHNLLLFEINASQNGYKGEALYNIYQQVADRIDTIPGVTSTTLSLYPLMNGGGWGPGIPVVPGAKKKPNPSVSPYLLPVKNNFLETMRIPLLAGRGFDGRDTENSTRAAIVNEAFVKSYFDDNFPVGQHFEFPNRTDSARSFEVVGIAKDSIYEDLRSAPTPVIYIPYQQHLARLDRVAPSMTYEVRTVGNPTALAPAIREVIRSLDSKIPMVNIRSQEEQVAQTMSRERIFTNLTSALGLLVLTLAGLGLYGVMSYNVTRRTREIGIRMALGAGTTRVLVQVMRETGVVVCIGIVLGTVASYEATKLAFAALNGWFSDQTMLFGVTPDDPVSIVTGAGFLLIVAAIAGYLPARRAARVDPLVALRYD